MLAIERCFFAPARAFFTFCLAAWICLVVATALPAHSSFEFGRVHLRAALDSLFRGLVAVVLTCTPTCITAGDGGALSPSRLTPGEQVRNRTARSISRTRRVAFR